MNKKFESQQKIDDYLFDMLSDEDKVAFEQMMKDDENLRKEVELTRQITEGFQIKGEKAALEEMMNLSSDDEMRAIISGAETKYHIEQPKKSIFKRLSIYIASAAAVILILLYVGLQPQYSNNDLFNEYYSDFKAASTRGGATAEKQSKQLSETVLMINMGQTGKAIQDLTTFSSDPEFEFKPQALWYLSLVYLKSGQREQAKSVLLQIETYRHDNDKLADKALELLDKLNEKKWL